MDAYDQVSLMMPKFMLLVGVIIMLIGDAAWYTGLYYVNESLGYILYSSGSLIFMFGCVVMGRGYQSRSRRK